MANTKFATRVSATHELFPPRLESPKSSLETKRLNQPYDDLCPILIDKFKLKNKIEEFIGDEYFGQTQLKKVHESQYFLKQVKLVVKANIQNRAIKIGNIAFLFNMSTRTFQRHLDKNNVSFRDIILQARKQLAKKYIHQINYSCQGTAEKLGYAEAATFIRNFKRWFDCTPGEYRKKFVNHTTTAVNTTK